MPRAVSPRCDPPLFSVEAMRAARRAAGAMMVRQQVIAGMPVQDRAAAARLQQYAFHARDGALYLQATAALQPAAPDGSATPLTLPALWRLGDEAYERRQWPLSMTLWRAARRFCGAQYEDADGLQQLFAASGQPATRRASGLLHTNELQEDRLGSLMSSAWSAERLDYLLSIDPAHVPALLLRAAVAVQGDQYRHANEHLARAFVAGEALGLRQEAGTPALVGMALPVAADWAAVAAWWPHQPLIALTAALIESCAPRGEATALQRMEDVADAEPDSGVACELLGRTYQRFERWPEAEGAWRRALLLPVHQGDVWMRLGGALERRGAVVEAERHLQRYLATAPDVAEAHHAIGMMLAEIGGAASARAAEAFRASFADESGDPGRRVEAAANAGNLLRRLGRPAQGVQLLQQALRVPNATGARAIVLGGLACAQWDAGQRDAALASYAQALAEEPGNVRLNEELAQRLVDANRTEESLVIWRRLCALQPQEQLHVENLAKCLLVLDRPAEATDLLEAACRAHGDTAPTLRLLAGAAAAQGAQTQALAYYERAMRADPDAMVDTAAEVSKFFQRVGWFDASLTIVDEGLRIDPGHQSLCQRKATALIAQGQLAPARSWLRRALISDPEELDNWRLLHVTLDESDPAQAAEAIDCLRQLSRLQPHDGAAALELASVLVNKEHAAEARAVCQRAVWLLPDSAFAHHVLANALCNNDEVALGCLSMQRALELEPDNELLPASYAAMLMTVGRDAEALQWLQRAHEIDPDDEWVQSNLEFYNER